VNNVRLEKDKPTTIIDGDVISFGPAGSFKYVFYMKDISTNPCKKMRLDENM
jgi:hypothetical protein